MCDQHHADRHILCSQCDMLVALPELGHGHKALCPRCGTTLTTEWDAPRQRPTAYALAALFMLLLSNLFPFIYMKVGGMTSQVDLLEIPGVMFSEDYASLGTFFLLFVQIVPAFCLVVILLLVNRVRMLDRLVTSKRNTSLLPFTKATSVVVLRVSSALSLLKITRRSSSTKRASRSSY